MKKVILFKVPQLVRPLFLVRMAGMNDSAFKNGRMLGEKHELRLGRL